MKRVKYESPMERVHREQTEKRLKNSKLTDNDLLQLKRVKDMVFLDVKGIYNLQENYKR